MITRAEYERLRIGLRKSAQYYGSVDLSGGSKSNGGGQVVIVMERQKPVRFESLEEAASYLTGVGMLPRSKVMEMLRARKGLINGRQVSYPSDSEKTAEFSDRQKNIFKNLAAASTLALPAAAYFLSKGKLRNAGQLAEKTIGKFNRKISFKNMMKLYGNEMLDYSKHGWKLELPGVKSVVDAVTGAAFGTGGSNAGLSSVSFDTAKRIAKMHMGVKGGLEAARKTGVNANVFMHELGHAHQAYAQPRFGNRSVPSILFERLRSMFMPLKYNPMYQEELRAWNNAMKFGKIDPEAMDAALNTYRTAIRGNQAVLGTGTLSGLAIGSRIRSNRRQRQGGHHNG